MAEDEAERRSRWKSRLRDIGSIVLGVLIALGLGAIASEIGWRMEAANARDALADELGEIIGQGLERERADQCVERKLDAIAAILTEAERAGRLPAVGSIGEPMYRTWSTGVWNSTISADIASHMDRDTLDNLSGVYEFVGDINVATKQEVTAWTELFAIVGPGRATSAAEIQGLRGAISRARLAHRMILIGAVRMDQIVKAYDLPVNRDTVAEYRDGSLARYCGPIAAPAGETYGQAPYQGVRERVRANPITRDSTGLPADRKAR